MDAVQEQEDENDEEDQDDLDEEGDGLGLDQDDETTNLLDGDLEGLLNANIGDERLMGSQFRLDNDNDEDSLRISENLKADGFDIGKQRTKTVSQRAPNREHIGY